jgi:hypothetical protein
MDSDMKYLRIILNGFLFCAANCVFAGGPTGTDQLDVADRQEFNAHLAKAMGCSKSANFTCSTNELVIARKFANSSRDHADLKAAAENIELSRQLYVRGEAQSKYSSERSAVEARAAQAEEELAQSRRAAAEAEERAARSQRQEQMARDAEERQSNRQASAGVGAAILQIGNDMAAMQNKFDRDMNVAMAETNRRLAAQAAERDRARAERDEREAERRAAERDRLARAEAERWARTEAAKPTTTDFPKYQPQVATIGSVQDKCAPGSSPARQANGQYVTIPPTAYCVKDPQNATAPASAQGTKNGSGNDASFVVNSGTAPTSNTNSNGGSGSNENTGSKVKKIEWGPVKLEAIAICNQSPKNSKWQCYGPVQNEPFHDGPTLESSLASQHCAGGTWAAGGPVLDGVQWQAYQCGHSLGAGDNDVAQRYSLITARRSYICPKDQLGDGRCATIYDGQDKH